MEQDDNLVKRFNEAITMIAERVIEEYDDEACAFLQELLGEHTAFFLTDETRERVDIAAYGTGEDY